MVFDVWEGGDGVRFDVGAEALGLLVLGMFDTEQSFFYLFCDGLRCDVRICD